MQPDVRNNLQELSGIVAGAQIPGARDYQEDTFHLEFFGTDEAGVPGEALLVLADGMGGHVGGARASELAVTMFAAHFAKAEGDVSQRMRESLDAANSAISDVVAQDPEYAGMGCTLLACQIADNALRWISVGDSPLWLLRKNEMIRLNEDHSMRPVLQDFVETGHISAEDMENDIRINQLRSAVIGQDVPMVDQNSRTLLANDRVILASDGLETLTTDEIGDVCRAYRGPADATDALLNEVNKLRCDGQDNATVVIYNNPGTGPHSQTALSGQPGAKGAFFGKLFPWWRTRD